MGNSDTVILRLEHFHLNGCGNAVTPNQLPSEKQFSNFEPEKAVNSCDSG